MHIKSLTLKNIRSYAEQKITFPQGIVLLSGDIGSGKSTILQAIEFALFGAQRGVLDASTLLRHGEKHAEVILELDEIKVTRTLKATKNGVQQGPGTLTTDTKEDLAPTELRARVLALLGYPDNPATFRYTVYASQEQMKQIILERSDTRLDTLRTIFGVDKYKQIQRSIDIIQKHIRKERSFLDGQLLDFGKKKLELAELQTQIQTISLDDAKKELDIKKQAYEHADALFEKLRAAYQKYEMHVQELKIAEQQFAKVDPQLLVEREKAVQNEIQLLQQKHDAIQVRPFDIEKTRSELMSLKELIARQHAQLASLKDKQQLYTKQIQAIPAVTDVASEYAAKKQYVEALEEQYTKQLDSLARKKHIEQQIAEHKEKKTRILGLDVCSLCGQNVQDTHKQHMCSETDTLVTKLEDELKQLHIDPNLDAKRAETKQQLEVLHKKYLESEASKKRVEEAKELKKELSSVSEKVSALEKISHDQRLTELEKQYAEAQSMQKLQEQKSQLHIMITEKLKALEDIRSRITEQVQTQKELSEKIAALSKETKDYDKTPFDQAKDARVQALEAYRTQESLHTKIVTEHTMLTKQIQQLSNEVAEKRAAKKQRDWLDSESQWLKTFFSPLVTQIEKKVLAQIHAEFNATFSHWFSQLIEDPSFEATVDMFFTPVITQNGYDVAISGLSGGERTSVAFAYRLAMYTVVKSLIPFATSGLLILDEPTEGFSTEQLDRVRDVLRSLGVSQLLIVSHEQHVEGFADSVIRIAKEGSESYVF